MMVLRNFNGTVCLVAKSGQYTVMYEFLAGKKHAGIVSVSNGSLPDIIFGSDVPVSEFTPAQEEETLDFLCGLLPELAKVREKEILPTDGVLNPAKFLSSPHIGIFPMPEYEDVGQMEGNIGLIVKKKEGEH